MDILPNTCLFLLGAGASRDAGIPMSMQMVDDVEKKVVCEGTDWAQYRDLYNYLKSSIAYSKGIHGIYTPSFNIESLLVVINEIEKRDRNIIYPFIGNWHSRLIELGGKGFCNLTSFKKLITQQLNDWVRVSDYNRNAGYYNGFSKLQSEVGYLLRIFSFNYDLCVERVLQLNKDCMGFGEDTEWHYDHFENESNKAFFLYKLHGSMNWEIVLGKLKISDDPVTQPHLIFGREVKLTSLDPFFYYTSELRKWCLNTNCKLIISIGFSFSDDYVNFILNSALTSNSSRSIIVVGPADNLEVEKNRVAKALGIENKSQIIVENLTAQEFLNSLNKSRIEKYLSNLPDSGF